VVERAVEGGSWSGKMEDFGGLHRENGWCFFVFESGGIPILWRKMKEF
jgi:hypothetical protein